MVQHRLAIVLVVLAAFLGETISATTQTKAGKVSGRVRNAGKKAIQNAVIVVSDSQSSLRYTTTTDEKGDFQFEGLPVGDYVLHILAQDYKDLRSEASLKAKEKFEQDFQLEPSGHPPGTLRPTPYPDLTSPRLIRSVRATYPESARRLRLSGVIMMDAEIGKDGKIAWISVRNPEEHPILVRAAVEAVSQWVYSPRIENGIPVSAVTVITTSFSVNNRS